MDEEQLRGIVEQLNTEVLNLKSNDLFIKKISNYLEAFKEAFEFCDVEMASQCFPNCKFMNLSGPAMTDYYRDQAKQFLMVLQGQIDTIVKESLALMAEADPGITQNCPAAVGYLTARRSM